MHSDCFGSECMFVLEFYIQPLLNLHKFVHNSSHIAIPAMLRSISMLINNIEHFDSLILSKIHTLVDHY